MKTCPSSRVVLKLSGKPYSVGRVPPTVKAVTDFLDKCPPDELFKVEELAAALRVSAHSIAIHGRSPALVPYRHGTRGVSTLWGNPRAIAELRRQIEAAE